MPKVIRFAFILNTMMQTPAARIKTLFVVAFAAINLISPLPSVSLGAPVLALPFAFMLPILSVAGNPVGRKFFQTPSWAENPLRNNNRLVFAQFGAVFLLTFAATLLLGSFIHQVPVSELATLAIALGAGYAVAIPVGLRLAKNNSGNR